MRESREPADVRDVRPCRLLRVPVRSRTGARAVRRPSGHPVAAGRSRLHVVLRGARLRRLTQTCREPTTAARRRSELDLEPPQHASLLVDRDDRPPFLERLAWVGESPSRRGRRRPGPHRRAAAGRRGGRSSRSRWRLTGRSPGSCRPTIAGPAGPAGRVARVPRDARRRGSQDPARVVTGRAPRAPAQAGATHRPRNRSALADRGDSRS